MAGYELLPGSAVHHQLRSRSHPTTGNIYLIAFTLAGLAKIASATGTSSLID